MAKDSGPVDPMMESLLEDGEENVRRIIESTGRFGLKAIIHHSAGVKGVYAVLDRTDNGIKALKILMNNQKCHEKADQEWYVWREIQGRGDTTHIVRIYEPPINLGEAWGTLMERAPTSLEALLMKKGNKSQALSQDQALDFITQISLGVNQAHLIGYSHNDLKPANTLVFSQTNSYLLKVGDFANSTQDSHVTSTVKGTQGYMAPEGRVVEGKEGRYQIRGDIYSMGVILYRLFHPRFEMPFEKDLAKDLIAKQESMAYVEQSLDQLHAPDKIKAVILRCLQKEARDRYASVDEFLADLATVGTLPKKPPLELQEYQRFITQYAALMKILSKDDLHHGTSYDTASLQDIYKIQTGLDNLLALDRAIRATDVSSYQGDIVAEVEARYKEARVRRYAEAIKDRDMLITEIERQSLTDSISLKSIWEMYKIMFCWGPPLSHEKRGKAYPGRSRYTLEEIEAEKFKEAIPIETLKILDKYP